MKNQMISTYQFSTVTTKNTMRTVLVGLLPAALTIVLFFGLGIIYQILLCVFAGMATEAIILYLRKKDIKLYITDHSTVLTAWLLALSVPPMVPWWIAVLGMVFAIGIGKQLYGGIGFNVFNPAMLGYVVLLISFPQQMSMWLASSLTAPYTPPFSEITTTVLSFLSNHVADTVDAWAMATPLELVKQNSSLTLSELFHSYKQLDYWINGWFALNISLLLGGLFLLYHRVIKWHAPVGMLLGLFVISLLFQNGSGSTSNGSPFFHLFSGATMMGAFFIITDPVSGATSNRGRFIFGLGAGFLTYIIRVWGGYPDGVAFATLLMNICAPLLDQYTQTRTIGHNIPMKQNNNEY